MGIEKISDEDKKSITKNIKEKIANKIGFDKLKKKCYALTNWRNSNKSYDDNIYKLYTLDNMLLAIYDIANGDIDRMIHVIEQLTYKSKSYGRTQVYNNVTSIGKIDMVPNENTRSGLEVINYKPNLETIKAQTNNFNNPIIYREDGQVKKTYQKQSDHISDIAKDVKEYFHGQGKDSNFIAMYIKLIKEYAKITHLNTFDVFEKIKDKKITMDQIYLKCNNFMNNENLLRRVIVINESVIEDIKDKFYMTEYKFYSNIRYFISRLLQDPVNTEAPEIFVLNGYDRKKLLSYLVDNDILIRKERVSDTDEEGNIKKPTMLLKFVCPKKNFDKKLRKMYVRLFIDKELNEEGVGGCMGGATSCSSSGAFIAPLTNNIINRKI